MRRPFRVPFTPPSCQAMTGGWRLGWSGGKTIISVKGDSDGFSDFSRALAAVKTSGV